MIRPPPLDGGAPRALATRRSDGSVLVESDFALPPIQGSIPGRLSYWADRTPDALFISEGERGLSYAEAEVYRRALSARLLALDLPRDRPVMVIGDNGVDHALFMLAATAVGITVAVVSPAYAAAGAAPWGKLARVVTQIEPTLIVADDLETTGRALAAIGVAHPIMPLRDLQWLAAGRAVSPSEVDAAESSVGLESVAKLLFTSGSTGFPKAVQNTQLMMVSNMEALALIWPSLTERAPVLVDWLPWNHTFGGNCCFNIGLWFGGRLHVDKGRPTPKAIGHTVDAIRSVGPTLYFNVPVGFELLIPILEQDKAFAAAFLGRLDFLFNAGAPMPSSLRARLTAAATNALGRCPDIAAGWGSTETAPFATALSFQTDHAANLGVPIPGTTIKMVPDGDRFELRVKGPNVTPGYWRDAAATAAAFDEEGFYRIGDAGKFADPHDPSAGIVFDGRVAENFKLASGTFVNVGALRLAVVSAGENLISDAVVAGEGRSELGVLVFANEAACRSLLGEQACAAFEGASLSSHPQVQGRLRDLLRAYNDTATGSSTRIARFIVLDEPPSAAHDEITDKGYVNQRRVLVRRAALVEHLFEAGMVL